MNIYDDASRMTKDAMDNSLRSFAIMTKGFQSIAAETTDFSKRAYEQQASFFEDLMKVKSLDKAFEVQSEYARSAYQNSVAQASKVGEIYVETIRQAYEPLETNMTSAANTGVAYAERTASKFEDKTIDAMHAAEDVAEDANRDLN